MKFVSHNLEDLMKKVKRHYTDNYLLLTEFINSNEDCVKLEDWEHTNASSCAASVGRSVKRYYRDQIKVIQRGGDVFLVKLEAIR